MMSLLCLPRGKLPLAFLAVPASENRRIECPCQTVDDFIGIRESSWWLIDGLKQKALGLTPLLCGSF